MTNVRRFGVIPARVLTADVPESFIDESASPDECSFAGDASP
jgi:hypothetical protein